MAVYVNWLVTLGDSFVMVGLFDVGFEMTWGSFGFELSDDFV